MWVRCNGADSDCSDWCGVAGFLCPVHTPDGTPCGLLNHLASACKVTAATLLLYMYIQYLQMQGADARNSAIYSSLEKNFTLRAAQCLLKKNSWCKYTCMYPGGTVRAIAHVHAVLPRYYARITPRFYARNRLSTPKLAEIYA